MDTVHEPDLIDLLNLHKKDIFNSLNCHQVATIQSYDPESKTCKATIVYKKTISKRNPLNGKYEDVLQDYPILINCPVINLSGGNSGIRFPIKKNDVAVIMFNDRDIDNWFLGKQSNGATNTKRMHHFSDGIALVGLFSKNDASKDGSKVNSYLNEGRNVIFNGDTIISLSSTGKVKIENSQGSLLPVIQQLLTDLMNLPATYNTTSPGNPIAPGGGTAPLLLSINQNLTILQGLLE